MSCQHVFSQYCHIYVIIFSFPTLMSMHNMSSFRQNYFDLAKSHNLRYFFFYLQRGLSSILYMYFVLFCLQRGFRGHKPIQPRQRTSSAESAVVRAYNSNTNVIPAHSQPPGAANHVPTTAGANRQFRLYQDHRLAYHQQSSLSI